MIQAIETRYKGYRFRSRLEARWAVFFDALGVKWEYEAQGYDLGAVGPYLPDFIVHGRDDFWVEIKGKTATSDELAKARELALQSRGMVMVVAGTPGDEMKTLYLPSGGALISTPQIDQNLWCLFLQLCKPSCGLRSICRPYFRAVTAARSARFEHGERP